MDNPQQMDTVVPAAADAATMDNLPPANIPPANLPPAKIPPVAKFLQLDPSVMDADMEQTIAEWKRRGSSSNDNEICLPLLWRCNLIYLAREIIHKKLVEKQQKQDKATGEVRYFFGTAEDFDLRQKLRSLTDRLFDEDELSDRIHRVQAIRDRLDPFANLMFTSYGRITGRAGTKLAGLNAMCGWPLGHVYSEKTLAAKCDRLITKTCGEEQLPIPPILRNARRYMIHLPERSEVELTYVDLCGGPGSFVDYMLTGYQWTARGMGITLHGYNRYQHRNFRISPGHQFQTIESVDGNLGNPVTRNNFIRAVRSNLFTARPGDAPNNPTQGVDVVLADGAGSSWKRPYDQQSLSLVLQMYELLTALCVLRRGGTFVIKLFDLFEPESVQLSYLLAMAFESVAIVKPELSRPSNSERYMVLKGHRFDAGQAPIISELDRFLTEAWQPGVPLGKTVSLMALLPYGMVERNTAFRDFIIESNRTLLAAQFEAISAIAVEFEKTWGTDTLKTIDTKTLWREPNFTPKPNHQDSNAEKQALAAEQALAVDSKLAQTYPYLERPTLPVADRETLALVKYTELLLDPTMLVGTSIDRSSDQLQHLKFDSDGWIRPTTGRECRDPALESRLFPDQPRLPLHGYFVSRRGPRDLHYLLCGKWVSVFEAQYALTLPPGTLVYGEIVPERTLKTGSMRWAMHIIDVLCLGYLPMHDKPFVDRQRYAALLVATIGNVPGRMPIRVKPLCRASEWSKFIDTCTTETYPGEVDTSRTLIRERQCYWFPLDSNTVFPVRYLTNIRDDVRKMESYALFPYDKPPNNEAEMAETKNLVEITKTMAETKDPQLAEFKVRMRQIFSGTTTPVIRWLDPNQVVVDVDALQKRMTMFINRLLSSHGIVAPDQTTMDNMMRFIVDDKEHSSYSYIPDSWKSVPAPIVHNTRKSLPPRAKRTWHLRNKY